MYHGIRREGSSKVSKDSRAMVEKKIGWI
jgi:hypothetical protein